MIYASSNKTFKIFTIIESYFLYEKLELLTQSEIYFGKETDAVRKLALF